MLFETMDRNLVAENRTITQMLVVVFKLKKRFILKDRFFLII